MKKILLVLSIFFLCGCSGTSSTTNMKPLYFVFATPLSTHTLWMQAREGMEKACSVYKIECDWEGPIRISTNEMDNVIRTALLKEADGIITQGVVDKSLIEEGMAQGIPIVLVDSPIKGSNPLATIAKNFNQQAELLLEDIEKKVAKDDKLYIGIQVSDKTFDLAIEQIEAVKKVFKKHPGGFEIVSICESQSDRVHARNDWRKAISENKNINVALNFSGEGAIGLHDALAYMKSDKDMLIYGVDDMSDTIDLIKAGDIEGSIVTSFYRYGYDSVKTLYEYVEKDIKPKDENLPATILLVNKNNVTSYMEKLK